MSRRRKPAVIDYEVLNRREKLPRVGDTLKLGDREYTVAALRVRVELLPVRDDTAED